MEAKGAVREWGSYEQSYHVFRGHLKLALECRWRWLPHLSMGRLNLARGRRGGSARVVVACEPRMEAKGAVREWGSYEQSYHVFRGHLKLALECRWRWLPHLSRAWLMPMVVAGPEPVVSLALYLSSSSSSLCL